MHLALQRVRTPGAREKHSMRYDAQFLVLAALLQTQTRSVRAQCVPWALLLLLSLPLPLVRAVRGLRPRAEARSLAHNKEQQR